MSDDKEWNKFYGSYEVISDVPGRIIRFVEPTKSPSDNEMFERVMEKLNNIISSLEDWRREMSEARRIDAIDRSQSLIDFMEQVGSKNGGAK